MTYRAHVDGLLPFSVNGLLYTGSAHQLWEQFRAAVWVILWSAVITFILMKLIGLVLRGSRYKDEVLEVGDLAIHGEEAFPIESLPSGSVPCRWPATPASKRTLRSPPKRNRCDGSAPASPAADATTTVTTRRHAE